MVDNRTSEGCDRVCIECKFFCNRDIKPTEKEIKFLQEHCFRYSWDILKGSVPIFHDYTVFEIYSDDVHHVQSTSPKNACKLLGFNCRRVAKKKSADLIVYKHTWNSSKTVRKIITSYYEFRGDF